MVFVLIKSENKECNIDYPDDRDEGNDIMNLDEPRRQIRSPTFDDVNTTHATLGVEPIGLVQSFWKCVKDK